MDHFPIVRVQGCPQGNQSSQASRHFRDVTDFVGRQATAKEWLLPVRQPLLNDLVAADGVIPYRLRYVPPARDVVE
jgi:hypothetical protein